MVSNEELELEPEEPEAAYVAQLEVGLTDDERQALRAGYAQYLADRAVPNIPSQRRGFVLGWIACMDAHALRPKVIHTSASQAATTFAPTEQVWPDVDVPLGPTQPGTR